MERDSLERLHYKKSTDKNYNIIYKNICDEKIVIDTVFRNVYAEKGLNLKELKALVEILDK